MADELTIGALSDRTGVATSALRYYEEEGLITATRSPGGQRRYIRDTIRRVSFIRAAQEVGLSLAEVKVSLDAMPHKRTPTANDWDTLAESWRPRIDAQIRMLERLRDRLTGCIGCGCLSMELCGILNPDDEVRVRGPGPRYILDEDP
jgi:MerR family redox-sensitive transcriptional activator SoxR